MLTALANDEPPAVDRLHKVLICVVIGVVALGLIGSPGGTAAGLEVGPLRAGLGWLVGAWGGGEIGNGNLTGVMYATVIPAAILGLRFGLVAEPSPNRRRRIEQKSRAWIFLLPAEVFIAAGLVIPLVRTIVLSFKNRDGSEAVGWANYQAIFDDPNSFNLDNWATSCAASCSTSPSAWSPSASWRASSRVAAPARSSSAARRR